MTPQRRLSPVEQQLLCCPVCRGTLQLGGDRFVCLDAGCATGFPLVDGIPILINERTSVFSIQDFLTQRQTFFTDSGKGALRKTLRRLVPGNSLNVKARTNYAAFARVLLAESATPRVLVIGGSIVGEGMEQFTRNPAISLVETDVAFGPRTIVICDAHDIPFQDGSFDAAIVQAVLEHVVDPYRCVEEIHRVLKPRGMVYAETPFMQQVHGGRYDFTRFTHLGHRRLFRRFEELDSGALCGPGMALSWSYQYFLTSFASNKAIRLALTVFARLTSFYLKYFDYLLINTAGALDAASGVYFMGRRTDQTLSDRDLIGSYKGAG